MLYLRAKEFNHRLKLLVKLRVKEVRSLFYVFFPTTITRLNYNGVYASGLIPTNRRLPSTAHQLKSPCVSMDRDRHSCNERAVCRYSGKHDKFYKL
jgi:hypothetical protein